MFDFRITVETAEGSVVFSFVRIYSTKGVNYFVSATGSGIRYHFHMEQKDGHWKIIPAPKPPDFILRCEEQLAQVIKEHQE